MTADPTAEMAAEQRELARHALGLPNDKRRSYRNRFATDAGPDNDAWRAMVEAGFAGMRPGVEWMGGMDAFWLTCCRCRAVQWRMQRLGRDGDVHRSRPCRSRPSRRPLPRRPGCWRGRARCLRHRTQVRPRPLRVAATALRSTTTTAPNGGCRLAEPDFREMYAREGHAKMVLQEHYTLALAERDAEIAKLHEALATADADRDAEIMAREELSEVARCEITSLRAEVSRLTAGIRDAVEGRYPRQVSGLDDRYCQHDMLRRRDCAVCMGDHLTALLATPPAPEDRT